jgi:hypothetical protein
MKDKNNRQTAQFDPEETGRIHAEELIQALAMVYDTPEKFAQACAQLRQALLDTLDAADPVQAIEESRRGAMPEALRSHFDEESEQRRKERGTLNDPLFPQSGGKRWD